MENVRNFRQVRKNGYDPSDVRRAFSEADDHLSNLKSTIDSGVATVDKLERELADLRNALRRNNSKPTFADLGSAFEQTLRVAEEQADKLVRDAEADAKVLRESARASAEELTRVTRQRSLQMMEDVDAELEDQRLDVERRISELVMEAEAKALQAQTIKETAQRREAALLAEVERDAAEVRSRLHQEIEDVKTELETLRQIAEREQLRIEREIKLALEEAERERLTRHEEAVRFVEERGREASDVIRTASDQADRMNDQTEEFTARARADAEALLKAARESASNLISRTRTRAETLSVLFDEHAAEMIDKAERRRASFLQQQETMREFSLELKALSSADALVSLDETEAQGN